MQKLTATDIENFLAELNIDFTGPARFSRSRLASELFSKINDVCELWKIKTEPSSSDDVIIGNG